MPRTRKLFQVTTALALLCMPSLAPADDPPCPGRPETFLSGIWESVGYPRGRLGIELLPMTPELREHFGVDPEVGVLVAKVTPESPAANAGIKAGDVILEADGKAIREPHDLVRLVGRFPEDEKLKIQLSRKGKEKEFEVVPRGEPWALRWEGGETFGPWMGKALRELREQMRNLEKRLRELEERFEQDKPPKGTDQT